MGMSFVFRCTGPDDTEPCGPPSDCRGYDPMPDCDGYCPSESDALPCAVEVTRDHTPEIVPPPL